jgi:uncharacterized protein (TIGR02444 family)
MNIWTFCEAFYGRQPVANLCLKLQNSFNINIGLVIWLCWHSSQQRFVDQDVFGEAASLSLGVYQPLIIPLRQLRKHPLLSQQDASAAIIEHLLSAEILLEKSLLLRLDRELTAKVSKAAGPDTVGLADYFRNCSVEDPEENARFLYASAIAAVA